VSRRQAHEFLRSHRHALISFFITHSFPDTSDGFHTKGKGSKPLEYFC
jgi:hypothetical protein